MVGKMSIFAEVKCARCDRKYSGIRSKCPYCGARRIGRGKYSEETDNSKGKMLIGVMIMAVLVVAAGVLLLTAPKPTYEEPPRNTDHESSPPALSSEDDVTSFPGPGIISPAEPSDNETDGPEDTAPVYTVESVRIMYSNITKTDFTAKVGEQVPLRASVEPVGIEEEIIWTSSNTDVFEVVPNTTGTNATVYGIGKGNATLTVTVGDKEATCIVRVN